MQIGRIEKAKVPTRRAFSERMVEYGHVDKSFAVFEADIGRSTYSYLFEREFPNRYFNMGIAEGNMVDAGAGMAADGRTVVVSSYGVFLSMRALESVRTFVCYPNLNVKFLSSHGGITAAIDGVTHQATEDIANMSTLPNMKILVPADTCAARKCFDIAIKSPGPVFVRLMRDPLFDIYEESDDFALGGSKLITEGVDITIVSYGDILFQAIQAANELQKEGLKPEVIDMYCLKPFDKKRLTASVGKTKALLVAENHQIRNGLGYELSNFCLKNCHAIRFDNLGLNDTFAESGNYYKLIEKYGISTNWIVRAAKELISRKNAKIV
jgi:transketolase